MGTSAVIARRWLAAGAVVVASACAGPARPVAPQVHPRVIGYLASWGVRSKALRIADIPGDRLTHIFYAFGRVSADGRAALDDSSLDLENFRGLREVKRRFPQLRVLISLGGWAGSKYFSDAAATPGARRALVASTIDCFIRGFPAVFDGVDVDWEFPVAGGLPGNSYRSEDRGNFTLLLAEFRRQLDSVGEVDERRYELTIAASARPWEVANLELAELPRYLDWINVMTYDYHSGDTIAHFNAPLYAVPGDPTPALNIAASLRLFLDARVPPRQLAVGVPFYGRGYGAVAPERDGLFQQADATGAPEWGSGGIDYRVLVSREPERHGFRRYWQREAQVPWLYNPERRIWITYDDSQSVELKARYAREQALGGIMFWELGGDDGTLLRAVRRGLSADRD
jgi:chitinase